MPRHSVVETKSLVALRLGADGSVSWTVLGINVSVFDVLRNKSSFAKALALGYRSLPDSC
jgi:hypothetical protein